MPRSPSSPFRSWTMSRSPTSLTRCIANGAWGGKATNEGVLFLISMGERKTRLEVGYGLEGVIPDGYLGGILRQIRPEMQGGRYGEALTEVARMLGQRIAESKGVTIPDMLARRRRAAPQDGLPWPMIIFGIVVVLFLLKGGGGRGGMGLPFPIFLPGGFGGGRSGGGGFGGYDSGDSGGSFGGFGGGDSGGGGASGDW